MRPVREATRRVVRPDDESRANDERALGECGAHGALAQCLERAVALVRDVVVPLAAELGEWAVLVHGSPEVRVDGDARHEAVETGLRKRCGRRLHVAREISACVDHRVPAPPGERVEPFLSVADDALDLRIQLRVRRATVEERQLVSALERRFRDRASEEPRPAEKQELHVSAASPSSRRSTSVSVL